MKRVVTIQDISCFGKCSITAAIPVISAAGIEVVPLPNMILSTHTGGFSNIAKRDLSDFIAQTIDQWKDLDLKFDAIYTGYIGSIPGFGVVEKFIETFKSDQTLLIVDPAMADNGKLYSGLCPDHPAHMAALCAKADVVVPNLTEAQFLLGKNFSPVLSSDDVARLLDGLTQLGAKNAVITGIKTKDTMSSFFKTQAGEHGSCETKRLVDTNFDGAGDVFSSCVVAALMLGTSLEKSVNVAMRFTSKAIELTVESKGNSKHGLMIEPLLSCVSDLIKLP